MKKPKSWKRLKKEIEAETKQIWLKEPEEVTRIRFGLIDSGAGSYKQYFSVLVFLYGQIRNLGMVSLYGITIAARDPSFSLNHLRTMTRIFTDLNSELCGYCGLTKVRKFNKEIIECLDSIEKKEELVDLICAFNLYVNRISGWVHHYFPWNVGALFVRERAEEIEKMAELIRRKTPE